MLKTLQSSHLPWSRSCRPYHGPQGCTMGPRRSDCTPPPTTHAFILHPRRTGLLLPFECALRTAPTSGRCMTPPSHIAHATPLGLYLDRSQTVTTPAPTPQVLLAAFLSLVLYSLLTPSEKRHRLVYLLTVCLFPPDTSSPRPGAQLCSQMDLQHPEQHRAPSRCSVIPAGSTPPPSPSTETIGLPRSAPLRAYVFSLPFLPSFHSG